MGGGGSKGAGGGSAPALRRKEQEGSWWSGRTSGSIGAYGFLYPGAVFADLGVDSWMLSRAAGVNAP